MVPGSGTGAAVPLNVCATVHRAGARIDRVVMRPIPQQLQVVGAVDHAVMVEVASRPQVGGVRVIPQQQQVVGAVDRTVQVGVAVEGLHQGDSVGRADRDAGDDAIDVADANSSRMPVEMIALACNSDWICVTGSPAGAVGE